MRSKKLIEARAPPLSRSVSPGPPVGETRRTVKAFHGRGLHFQSSSDSSSSSSRNSSSSSSSSSSTSCVDSTSKGSVLTTFRSAPHSSQLRVSPSSTSSSSTSIVPSHTGHVTIALPPEILRYDSFACLQVQFLEVSGINTPVPYLPHLEAVGPSGIAQTGLRRSAWRLPASRRYGPHNAGIKGRCPGSTMDGLGEGVHSRKRREPRL